MVAKSVIGQLKKIGLAAAAVCVAGVMTASSAQASVWMYYDPVYDFSMSFPDTWRMQTVDTPTTRIRIAAPYGQDAAQCRVEATRDGRLLIYARHNLEPAVHMKLTRDYWQHKANEEADAQIHEFYKPASFGDGDATGVIVSYEEEGPNGDMVRKRALMLSSIYGEHRYTAKCSANEDKFHEWFAIFGSIIESVEFEQRYNMVPTGFYRDFLKDDAVIFVKKDGRTDYQPLLPSYYWPWQK